MWWVALAAAPWSWFLLRDRWVAMEVVAILLPALVLPAVVALAVAGAVRRSTSLLGAAVAWLLFATAAIAGPWLPQDTGTPRDAVRVAVANAHAENWAPREAVDALAAVGADVLVVPEVTDEIDVGLRERFAHRVRVGTRYIAAIGVYSDLPVEELPADAGALGRGRVLRVLVDGRFVLWALHAPRPWFTDEGSTIRRPREQSRILRGYLDQIDREDRPVVIAGDLNLTDRGPGYRSVVDGRRDAMRGIRGSYTSLKRVFRPLLLRIDHIVVPPEWCADGQDRFGIPGSDHRGVTARVGPCR